jgi:enoyl-CoA hydratase/carnithine racemase
MVLAQRFGGTDALAAGIADILADADDVLPRSVGIAAALAVGKSRATVGAIKRVLYPSALALLGSDPGPDAVAALVAIGSTG